MRAELVATGITLETTPTERGAVFRFAFPEGVDSRIILEGVKGETHWEVRPDRRTVVGFTRGNSGGVPANFAHHFILVLDRPVEGWATFKGDDLGWTGGELRLPGGGTPVLLARFLTAADDLRDYLNVFAADLETRDYSPNHGPLMRHVIQSQQLVTLRKPLDAADEVTLEKVLLETCRFLAARTDGVYQIDDVGWFAPDGTMLLQEY